MKTLKCINGINKIDKIKYNYFVFDVETTCLEPMSKNFVFGCLYGYNYKKVFYRVEDFIQEFNKSKYKKKYIFAHNAEFDLLTIFGNIFTKIDSAAIFNGKFISARYKDITFADSMNIYPTSVARLGEMIGLKKIENCKVSGGSLTVKNITSEDIEYCFTDCEIVYRGLLRIFEMTGKIKITLPSLAMYDFRYSYLREDIKFNELVDEFYDSYYGGRTEAFFIGKCNAQVYDINSMYPWAMSQVTLPDVMHLKKITMCDISYLNFALNHYEGMCKVTVNHKNTHFGYLPYRAKLNHATKLIFPVGEFTTTVNFNELRFAINQGAVTVKKVFYIVCSNPMKNIFYDYVHDNFRRRRESANELDKNIYKLKMNSLYGRFGMKLKYTTRYYESIPYDFISTLKQAAQFVDIKLFNSIRADCFLVTENAQSKSSFNSIPTIASYITSEARIILLKSLIANEHNGVVYCDTDSIFITGYFHGCISDEFGAFKREDKTVIEICGLKNYKYTNNENKTHIVIKGISRGSTSKASGMAGVEVYESQRYYKTKASLRQGVEAGTAYTMVKRIVNHYDKREVLADGTTRPLICKDDILINATTFIAPRTACTERAFRYEPQTIREAVMMFFVTGGKVWTEHMKDYVVGSSKEELKLRRGLHAADGVHMDVFCDYVPDEFYTDRPIDVFQDVLLSYNTAKEMQAALQKLKDAQEQPARVMTEYEFEYDTPF